VGRAACPVSCSIGGLLRMARGRLGDRVHEGRYRPYGPPCTTAVRLVSDLEVSNARRRTRPGEFNRSARRRHG